MSGLYMNLFNQLSRQNSKLSQVFSMKFEACLGGGGFRPIILETLIMRYGLKGKGRTRPEFWVHAHNFTHVRPRSKNGAKHKNINQKS